LAEHPVVSISADIGETLTPVSEDIARAVAERFSGQRAAHIDGPFDYDQWTVHARYDPYRPFYRLDMDDTSGTSVYVSVRSGEVIQRTRRMERAWNWVGAVVHWLNPTILRKNEAVWHRTMWSLALSGIVLAFAGIWLGIIRYVNLKRLKRPGLSPFTGWLRWHHSMGLFAAAIVLNWISSGWLSLDRGTLFSRDQPTVSQLQRLRGISLADAARSFPVQKLRELGNPREIEITALGGHPILVVRDSDPHSSEVVTVDDSGAFEASAVIPDSVIFSAVRSAWSPVGVVGIHAIAESDVYRVRSNPLPDTARRVVLDDPAQTWIQIDAASGQVISILDTSRRVYRWIVDGAHNLDFPIFDKAGPLRHVLILIATTTGFVFSCSGVVIGVKRLGRALF
jgi:hypothetical protein